jgi:hypothetical protein
VLTLGTNMLAQCCHTFFRNLHFVNLPHTGFLIELARPGRR